MTEICVEQARIFRLRGHHLDCFYGIEDAEALAGACGIQNSPPGSWETSLFNRVSECRLEDLEELLYMKRRLLQSWSFRGAPFIFPASESDVFLSALLPQEDEPWIYTQGIGLALDYLGIPFEELLGLLLRVIPGLDGCVIVSKTSLDQTLAEWMLPLLPACKQELWNHPSMYGNPDKQTVGGAVVSFLLRPCSFHGLVVFGNRSGISPSFTSYKNWSGHTLQSNGDAAKKLVRKFLHCYGPATLDSFVSWLGCSRTQGKRLWDSVKEEIEPVKIAEKKAFILSEDKEQLINPLPLERELLLLGAHDPFLDQRDRSILLPDKSLHKNIWKYVSNPGAIVYRGEIIGIWTSRKKGGAMEIKIAQWSPLSCRTILQQEAEKYAKFRQLKLTSLDDND